MEMPSESQRESWQLMSFYFTSLVFNTECFKGLMLIYLWTSTYQLFSVQNHVNRIDILASSPKITY